MSRSQSGTNPVQLSLDKAHRASFVVVLGFFGFDVERFGAMSRFSLCPVIRAPRSAASKRRCVSCAENFSLFGSFLSAMPNPKRLCIFYQPGCNRASKEDVWPTWLSQYIPRNLKKYTTMSALVHPTHSDIERETIDGDPRSRRVKFVCRSCNNGWMSVLQNTAKPVLLPLVRGGSATLTQRDKDVLAAWCTMSVMTSDFFYPEKQAIPQADRDYLRANMLPPENGWKIWIGYFSRTNWMAHWVKNSMPISSEEHIPEIAPNGIPRPNTQATTLIFGKLYVHVFSSVHADLVAKATIGGRAIGRLVRIWPRLSNTVVWPPLPMTDRDADDIAGAIFNELDRLSR